MVEDVSGEEVISGVWEWKWHFLGHLGVMKEARVQGTNFFSLHQDKF